VITVRHADGIVEFVKTPEEFKQEKLLEFLEKILIQKAQEGDQDAMALLKEIEDYEQWFSQNFRR